MNKKERFFGLHFDYHAKAETKDIGKGFDPSLLREIIEEVKPDFIQCDTKGHPGYASYETKVGSRAPHLERDLLRMWRDVTKEYNVPLYSHYSGLWDMKAAIDHPEWAIVSSEGNETDRMSPFSEYANKLLIPMMGELINDYQIDGAWVDGECWALICDYSLHAKKAYEKEFNKPLSKWEEIDQKEYLKFLRNGFVKYVKHYVDEVHKINPNFMITSNWFNTAWVPDSFDFTDYISGDLSPTNSVDSARFDGRIMAMYNRMWDIMSWGINFPVHHVKSALQLEQEASIILALGGGFQVYNLQDPAKVVQDPWAIPAWSELSKFVHERKEYCYGGTFVPDLGILYSQESYYEVLDVPYYRDNAYNLELYGFMLGLLDQGNSVNVVSEDTLNFETLKKYPRFALSNSFKIKEKTKDLLLKYVLEGGELLLEGKDTIAIFANDLSLKLEKTLTNPIYFIETNGATLEIRDEFSLIKEGKLNVLSYLFPAIVEGDLKCTNPPPYIHKSALRYPSLGILNYGKGKIILVPENIGKNYLNERTFELENFFNNISMAFSSHLISHNHLGELEVIYRENKGHKYLHLINLLGEHRVATVKSFNKIPPIEDVNLIINCPKEPKEIISEPDGEKIPFQYNLETAQLSIHLDEIKLYTILAFRF